MTFLQIFLIVFFSAAMLGFISALFAGIRLMFINRRLEKSLQNEKA